MEANVCFFRPKADVQKHTFWVHLKVSTKPGPVLRAGARGESWAPVVLRQWLALALSKVYRLTERNLRDPPIPGSARTTSALDFQLHWPPSTSDAGNLPFVLVKGVWLHENSRPWMHLISSYRAPVLGAQRTHLILCLLTLAATNRLPQRPICYLPR